MLEEEGIITETLTLCSRCERMKRMVLSRSTRPCSEGLARRLSTAAR